MEIKLKQNLKRLLNEQGVRAADPARRSGVSPSVISEWLSGREPRNIKNLRRVAEELKVTIDNLCFENAYGAASPAAAPAVDIKRLFPLNITLANGTPYELNLRPLEKPAGD